MNHQECLEYLEKIQNLGIKFGLDNVREVLSAFGHPHLQHPSVLVAGSNGKGSVCAMLSRILALHGLHAGLFTSPHLVDVEERIRINDDLIPKRTFSRLLTQLRETIDSLIDEKKLLNPPTYFEHICCLAFLYFARRHVDMALLEVGMGGRFDATNIVHPVACVITTISAEHQKFLGETLGQIASEKAGIIKPHIPVICGVRDADALQVIKKRTEELEAPFLNIFEPGSNFSQKKTKNGYTFQFIQDREIFHYVPALPGEHQGQNAAIAIATALTLSQKWKPLEKDKILEGIRTARWEGRLETISRHPLVLLDGAHNEEGATALRKYAQDCLTSPLILVFASMRDKNIEKIADILFPIFEKVILTRFPYFRAANPEELKEKALRHKHRLILEPDVEQAYKLALKLAGPEGTVLVAGSLFLVGEIKKVISKPKHSAPHHKWI
jgi:dihydrofolate synthase/folylpolyglutamate synthase